MFDSIEQEDMVLKRSPHPAASLPPSLELNRIVSVRQMAEALGYSVDHLRRMYYTGKIPAPTSIDGRKLGWPASTLIALTGGQPTQPEKVA